jgi:hypothetical protein
MASLLIRRRRPIADTPTLDGTRGAGRIVHALAELGIDLGQLREFVVDAEASAAEIDGLDLGRQFELVVLGSHLVNRPEEAVRRALLALARRHLEPGGRLLVEHHPIDWAETAADVPPTPGGQLGMLEVRREPPFVSAVSVYDVGGRVVRQPFRARVLSDAELAATCNAGGLAIRGRLSPSWLDASSPARPEA